MLFEIGSSGYFLKANSTVEKVLAHLKYNGKRSVSWHALDIVWADPNA